MQSRTSVSYIDAYDKIFLHWSRFGIVPSFVRLDAETSADLEKFLTDVKKVTFQYFPTGTHRANLYSYLEKPFYFHACQRVSKVSPVLLEQVNSTR
jgi:hypothetical protein